MVRCLAVLSTDAAWRLGAIWVREVSGYHICSSACRMDRMIIAFELVRVSMSTFNVSDVHPFNTTR